ncbi:Ankyrin repeats (3 copies) [Popillia japonica]|uniref:Ankyrin repeats (3 copies) n=1 Tax=Popillia japonica TaxID=7064 RepID=A0AAW1JKV6_POPJA
MGCLSETTRNQPCDGYITNKTDTVKSPDTTHVHLNFIEILLEAGANSNVAFAFNGTSPLYFAVQTDNVSVVKTLLKFGAKVNDTCRDGNTALHAAALYGSLPIVECLLNHKADARLTNAKGETARDVAINQGNTDIVNLLAQPVETEKNILIKSYYDKECMGFVSNMEDENCSDETPRCLHSAARIGDINIIRHLVDTGLSINSQNMYGCTPLRIAARQGRVDVAKFLIEKGANVNTRDSFNISPLHSATWQENPMISELLLQNGANVNSLDYYGNAANWFRTFAKRNPEADWNHTVREFISPSYQDDREYVYKDCLCAAGSNKKYDIQFTNLENHYNDKDILNVSKLELTNLAEHETNTGSTANYIKTISGQIHTNYIN